MERGGQGAHSAALARRLLQDYVWELHIHKTMRMDTAFAPRPQLNTWTYNGTKNFNGRCTA